MLGDGAPSAWAVCRRARLKKAVHLLNVGLLGLN